MIFEETNYCGLCRLPRRVSEAPCQICGDPAPPQFSGEFPSTLALRLIGERRLNIAWAELEDEVSRGIESGAVCLLLAWLAFAFQDERAMETWSHECLRLSPDSPEPHLLLGLTLQRAERWAEAVAEYDVALSRPCLEPERRERIEGLRLACQANIPEF